LTPTTRGERVPRRPSLESTNSLRHSPCREESCRKPSPSALFSLSICASSLCATVYYAELDLQGGCAHIILIPNSMREKFCILRGGCGVQTPQPPCLFCSSCRIGVNTCRGLDCEAPRPQDGASRKGIKPNSWRSSTGAHTAGLAERSRSILFGPRLCCADLVAPSSEQVKSVREMSVGSDLLAHKGSNVF